jgi:predicted PurR-regulated permease PerM/methanogenic corrinoid protein MtbC1
MAQPSTSEDISHLLAVVIAVVAVSALYFAKVIFVPLALGILLAFVLSPLVSLLQRARLGRVPSAFVAVLLTLVLVGVLAWIVTRQFAAVLDQVPHYESNLEDKIQSLHLKNRTLQNASATLDELRRTWVSAVGNDQPSFGAIAAGDSQPVPVRMMTQPTFPVESVESIFGWILQIVIVIVLTAFLLIQRENVRNRFIFLAGQHRMIAMTRAIDEASERVSRYLRAQMTVNALYGGVIALGLHLIGIPGGLLWAVVVGVLRFVPYIGPPLGAVVPVLFSLAIFPGWKEPTLTLGLFIGAELTSAYGIEPALYGSRTGVSPIAILLAAIFWTFLWGPIGLVLSMPLTVCLVALGRHVPHLGFLELLLGEGPVWEPDTRVYQRLLAMDQDEAEQVLEDLLAKQSLADVYDSVLIPVLSLAEQHHHHDRIDKSVEDALCQSVREIIDDLFERYKVSDPPGDEAKQPIFKVVCIPARDEADEIVGIMLAQLLEQAGHSAHSIACGSQQEMFRHLSLEDADVVCISALSPFVISHARSIYRALRARSPKLPIVVGLWSFPGDTSKAAQRMGLAEDAAGPVTKLIDAVRLVNDGRIAGATVAHNSAAS